MPDWDSLVLLGLQEEGWERQQLHAGWWHIAPPGQREYRKDGVMEISWKSRALAEKERNWHLYQLRNAPLTGKEREYHQDMVAWLEQHYELRRYIPAQPTFPHRPA